MIWRVVLSFYILSYVTGTWLPYEHKQISNDAEIYTTKQTELHQNQNGCSYRIPEAMNKNMAACDDIWCQMDVKKILVDVLEYIKQNPYDLDIFIQKLKFQIEQAPQFPSYSNNKETDVIKSLWQPHLESDDFSQCIKAVTQLETAAHNAYLHLRKSSCLNKMLPLYEKKLHLNFQSKDRLNVNIMVLKFLKDLKRMVEQPNSEKPSNTIRKIIAHDWKDISDPIRDEIISPTKPLEEFYMRQIGPLPGLIQKLQPKFKLLCPSKNEIQSQSVCYTSDIIQESLPNVKPEHLMSGLLQPVLPQQQVIHKVMQDYNVPVTLAEINSAPINFKSKSDSIISGLNPMAFGKKTQELRRPKITQDFTIPGFPSGIMLNSLPFQIKPQLFNGPDIMPDVPISIPSTRVNPVHKPIKNKPQAYNRPDITQNVIISEVKPKDLETKAQEVQKPIMVQDLSIPLSQSGVNTATTDFEITHQEYYKPEIFSSNPELPICVK